MRFDAWLEINDSGELFLEVEDARYRVDNLEVKDFLEWVIRGVISE
jgi:hypothetical protein